MPDILTKKEVEALRCCLRRDVFPRVANTIETMIELLEKKLCCYSYPKGQRCDWCNKVDATLAAYHGTKEEKTDTWFTKEFREKLYTDLKKRSDEIQGEIP